MSITDSRFFKIFADRTFQNFIGIFLTLVAAASLVYSWKATQREQQSTAQLRSYVQCQGEWTNFFYQAIISGRDSSQEAAQALDELINTISTSTSREQSAAALEKYKAARAKQIQSQNEHPLPEAPKNVCQLED
jgi:hypothetical protein